MPDSPSPIDDPFADLFGKLPDPRAHDVLTATGSTPAPAAAAVPASRRAAREAAARETGAHPVVPAAQHSWPGVPAVPAPVSTPAPVWAPGPVAASAPVSTPAPLAAPVSTPAPLAAPVSAPVSVTPTALTVSGIPAADPKLGGDGMLAGLRAPVSVATTALPRLDDTEWDAARDADASVPALPYSRTGGNRVITAKDNAARTPQHDDDGLADLFGGGGRSGGGRGGDPDRPRRRRRVGGWIALGIILLLLGGIAAGGAWAWNTYEDKIREVLGWEEPKDYDDGLATGEALVTISSGDNGSAISQSLYDAGVTKTPEAFYDMLVDTDQNPTFYPGVYTLQQKMTSAAALLALQDPANKLEHSALLREGLTVEQTLPILAEGLGLPIEDFEAAVADPSVYGVRADSLEGWLFPAMYTFDPGATATDVIQTMVDRTVQSLDAAGVPVEERARILTIASMIQKEARFEDDFYKVSRVIENRLVPSNQETFGKLQFDSTAKYGVGEDDLGSLDVSTNAQTNDNPWNTYLHPGLPIGPIANPGDLAIDAAMHPADGPWLYFVTVDPSTGETVFTNTYSEHLAAVEQWKKWCTAHPDYPC